jgi:predicted flap endonuclease-1-like 5' DNA nuclease
MRSDVTLYIVATFFFALAITSIVLFTDMNRIFWIALSTTLGIIIIGAGYSQRPIAKKPIKTLPTTTTTDETPSIEAITQEALVEEAPAEEALIADSSVLESVSVDAPQTVETIAAEETAVLSEESMLPPLQEEQASTVTAQGTIAASTPVEPEEAKDEAPLTSVKGVREKRAAQLNALGIYTVKELSQASVETLAKNLKPISQKQAADLIEAAKQQLKQA